MINLLKSSTSGTHSTFHSQNSILGNFEILSDVIIHNFMNFFDQFIILHIFAPDFINNISLTIKLAIKVPYPSQSRLIPIVQHSSPRLGLTIEISLLIRNYYTHLHYTLYKLCNRHLRDLFLSSICIFVNNNLVENLI